MADDQTAYVVDSELCMPVICGSGYSLSYQNDKNTRNTSRNTRSVKYVNFMCKNPFSRMSTSLCCDSNNMAFITFTLPPNIDMICPNEIPDVLEEKPRGNCPLFILFGLASADELNLDVSLSHPLRCCCCLCAG